VDLESRYEVAAYDHYAIGDASFHHGWCLHSAPENKGTEARLAYSISFIADNLPLLEDEGHIRYPDNEDSQSYHDWIGEVGWGGVASHPLLPIVYCKEAESSQKPAAN
jgi:hypothetical protein